MSKKQHKLFFYCFWNEKIISDNSSFFLDYAGYSVILYISFFIQNTEKKLKTNLHLNAGTEILESLFPHYDQRYFYTQLTNQINLISRDRKHYFDNMFFTSRVSKIKKNNAFDTRLNLRKKTCSAIFVVYFICSR